MWKNLEKSNYMLGDLTIDFRWRRNEFVEWLPGEESSLCLRNRWWHRRRRKYDAEDRYVLLLLARSLRIMASIRLDGVAVREMRIRWKN